LAALEKIFKCLSCGQEIKLERKLDNSGWNKFNLDGTAHKDERKKSNNINNNNSAQIAELTKQISELKDKVRIIISQIQMLRSEVKKSKCISE
jgi:TolA-binding protein